MLKSLLHSYLRFQLHKNKKTSMWYLVPISFIIGGSIIVGEVFIFDALYNYFENVFKATLEGWLTSLLAGTIFLTQGILLMLLLRNGTKEKDGIIENSFQEFKDVAAAFLEGYRK